MASSQVWRHSAGLFITPDQPGLSAQEDDGQTAGASSSRFVHFQLRLHQCFVAASSLPHHCFFTGSSMLYRCFIAASLAFTAVSAPFKRRCFAASLPLCRCFVAANLKRQDGVRNTWQHLVGTRIRGHRGGPDGTSCFSGCNTKTAKLGETLKLFFFFFSFRFLSA